MLSGVCSGVAGVVTLMRRRAVVVGVIPNVRNEVAICSKVEKCQCWSSTGIGHVPRHTLLFNPKENTISECTFRLFNLVSIKSLTALYTALKTWILETIYYSHQPSFKCNHVISNIQTCPRERHTTLASIKAYSKFVFPSKSCFWRNSAFWRELKRPMWTSYPEGRCSSWMVCRRWDDMLNAQSSGFWARSPICTRFPGIWLGKWSVMSHQPWWRTGWEDKESTLRGESMARRDWFCVTEIIVCKSVARCRIAFVSWTSRSHVPFVVMVQLLAE